MERYRFDNLMEPLISDYGPKYFSPNRINSIWDHVKSLQWEQFERIVKYFYNANQKPSVNDFAIRARAYKETRKEPCDECTSWGWVAAEQHGKQWHFYCPNYCYYAKAMKARMTEHMVIWEPKWELEGFTRVQNSFRHIGRGV